MSWIIFRAPLGRAAATNDGNLPHEPGAQRVTPDEEVMAVPHLTRRVVDVVTRGIYVLAGAFYLLLGAAMLLLGTGLVPVWLHDRIFEIGQHNPVMMHLIQETGTLWVLVGILLVWFARHYDPSTKFHWAMTFYLSLDAFVHWFSAYGKFENEPRAIFNAIPFAVFLVLGLLRARQPDPQMEPTRAGS